jgi:hypothetical protein
MEMRRMTEMIKIMHCIYIGSNCLIKSEWKYIPIPLKFRELLLEKAKKWEKELIEFTVAHDIENEIWTIAIIMPKENFKRDIGEKIVMGRLERYKGERPKMRKSGLEEMHYYKEMPRTIYQLKREAD